jgi:hypothetical protein
MKKLTLIVGMLLIAVAVYGATPKFKTGDLVYICNEERIDPTPLCITNKASMISEVRWADDKACYQYRIKVYADKDTRWNNKWWVIEKYVHKW